MKSCRDFGLLAFMQANTIVTVFELELQLQRGFTHVRVTKCVLSANVYTCMSIRVGLGRHCEYMLGFVRVARQL